MENFDEMPFSRTFGVERKDIFLLEPEFHSQVEVTNKKRREIKKIGLDWITNNFIPLNEFNVNLLHINRIPDRTPGDLWRLFLFYGENHLSPIIQIEVDQALLFIRKSDINRIIIRREFCRPRFLEILEQIESLEFIQRVLQDGRFYEPTKYQISNLKRDENREIETIIVNIEESAGQTLTPFVRLEDFDRVDAPLVHRNPRNKEDLGVLGTCRVKLSLHFSHLQATNSQYILTIYVKKCGFEV